MDETGQTMVPLQSGGSATKMTTAGQEGSVAVAGQIEPNPTGTASINTNIWYLSSTQRHKIIHKTFKRAWQVYLHGNKPGKMTYVTSQDGDKYTIIDEGWQIMLYTISGASRAG